MRRRKKHFNVLIYILIFIIFIVLIRSCSSNKNEIGKAVDSYKGVEVYDNGKDYLECHGENYSKSGYLYGYKWQCVEYVKRFYYIVKKHSMPDVLGNARDFFDNSLEQGEYNKERGLYQYKNGGDVKPKVDDIIVFNNTKYGHVAIVTKVADDYIEIIQQNVYGHTRQNIKMVNNDGIYTVGTGGNPAGWLRK